MVCSLHDNIFAGQKNSREKWLLILCCMMFISPYPAQVGPATNPRPLPGERGFFSRTDELRGAGWIAVNGDLVDTECGWCRKVLPDFFLDVLRLSSIRARAVFLVALTI